MVSNDESDPQVERVDRRVTRTKERLAAALFELIQERRWDKIRVQDVLERSGTSRSAFYAHYENKYDLLTSSMPTLFVPIGGGAGLPDFLPLFEHVDEMSEVMAPLLTQPVLSDISDTFQRSMVDSWLAYFASCDLDFSWVEAQLLAGGLTAVLRAYVIDENREPPGVVAASFQARVHMLLGDPADRAAIS